MNLRRLLLSAILLSAVGVLAGCHRPPPLWQRLEDTSTLPIVRDDADRATLKEALDHQLAYLDKVGAQEGAAFIEVGGSRFTLLELAATYRALRQYLESDPAPEELAAWLLSRFQWFRLVSRRADGKLLVTSYFAPEYAASPARTERFTVPLYPPPADLPRNGGRYFTHDEIDRGGVLNGKVEAIAWLESEIDKIFLQMQGSGFLLLPDNTTAVVGYAGDNGHPFVALGNLLLRDQELPRAQMSMQGIRAYFKEHPERLQRYVREMPRYIFFQFKEFPATSLNLPAVSMRTLSVDPTRIPYGTLAYLETRRPVFAGPMLQAFEPMSLLVLAQDTGGGIRGDHVEFFWGSGEEAGRHAGVMNEPSELYLLLPIRQ
jgi:membrane-bound lytic murein transglycosylase A